MKLFEKISNRLGAIASKRKLEDRFRSLAKVSVEPKKDVKPLKIGFFSTPGTFGCCVDLLLGLLLKKSGHDVTIVYADESLPLQETHNKAQPEKWESKTRQHVSQFKRLADCAGVRVVAASSISGPLDSSNQVADVDGTVHMSLLRHYRVGEIDDSLPKVEQRRDLLAKSVNQSLLVGQYLSRDVSVDRFLVNHGLYATTGPARLVALANSVPVLTFDRAKRQGCMNFTWTYSSDKWNIEGIWVKERENPMSEQDNQELDAYLASRLTHSEDIYQYNSGAKQSQDQLRSQLDIPEGKRVYVLFTNVLWDAASSERDLIFSSPIEWAARTIEFARQNPDDFHLIVRIHPAELVVGTDQTFGSVIQKFCPEMPDNVTVLQPDSEINSWALYDICDLGLVHTTTCGLELALLGKPVVVASDTHYRNKGFTIDPDSSETYEQALTDPSSLTLTADQTLLARKYAHLSLVRYQYRFPWITFSHDKRTVISTNDLDDILKDRQFQNLHQCILEMKPILNP